MCSGGIRELVRREFVRPARVSSVKGEEEFSIWHALVRDVAYQQIPRARRAEKHVAAAAWVEQAAQERIADHAEILVHHYDQALELSRAAGGDGAGLHEPLVRALVLAGDRALRLDVEAAAAAYRRAVELSDDAGRRVAALVKLGDALQEQGRLLEAEQSYEDALETSREACDELASARAMLGLSRALWRHGQTSRARELTIDAIATLEHAPGPDLVLAYERAAAADAIGGRSHEAIVWAEKAISTAGELGIENVSRTLQMRGLARINLGDPEGLEDLREAVVLGERLGLGIETAIAYLNLGEMVSVFESLQAGMELTETSLEFSRRRGLTHNVMWTRAARLVYLYELAEWDELLREADELLRWDREHGGTQIETMVLTATVHVLAHRGRLDEATRNVAILLPRSREIGDPQVLGPALVAAAVVAALHGRLDDAIALVEEFVSFADRARADVLGVLPVVVHISIAGGRPEIADGLVGVVDGAPGPIARSSLAYSRALLAEARGELGSAASFYREAVAGWGDWGSVIGCAYAQLGLGRCGDEGAAREGAAIFERLRAVPFTATARAA